MTQDNVTPKTKDSSVHHRKWYRKLHYQILIGMAVGLVAGIVGGSGIEPYYGWMGGVFLRLLKMLVVPLVASSLIVGVLAAGEVRKVGRMGVITLLYYISTSGLAIFTGLVLVNTLHPGTGIKMQQTDDKPKSAPKLTAQDLLFSVIPENPFASAATFGVDRATFTQPMGIKSPCDGNVAEVKAKEGDELGEHQVIAIIDCSGTEGLRKKVSAPARSSVTELNIVTGDNVSKDKVIAKIEPIAGPQGSGLLGVIFFSLLFGIFTSLVGGRVKDTVESFFSAVFEVMMKMTSWIIRLAPVGVAALLGQVVAKTGIDVLLPMLGYMGTVAGALAIHALLTLPIILLILARRKPSTYFGHLSSALATAFSTASSNAALPVTMKCIEKNAGISNRVTSFVLPLGATINMDGTALYECVAAIFVAQAYGIDLTVGQQALVFLTALMASIGAAGIPHAGLVMMAIVFQSAGLPLEGTALILGVDRILDMCRTAVNVWSDSVGTAVVSRLENQK